MTKNEPAEGFSLQFSPAFLLKSLTSTVHEFPDVGGGHQVVSPQVVGQLAANRHNDRHDQMGQSGHHPHLKDTTVEGR